MLDVHLVTVSIAAEGMATERLSTDGRLHCAGKALNGCGLPGDLYTVCSDSEGSGVRCTVRHGRAGHHPAEHVSPLLIGAEHVTDKDTA